VLLQHERRLERRILIEEVDLRPGLLNVVQGLTIKLHVSLVNTFTGASIPDMLLCRVVQLIQHLCDEVKEPLACVCLPTLRQT